MDIDDDNEDEPYIFLDDVDYLAFKHIHCIHLIRCTDCISTYAHCIIQDRKPRTQSSYPRSPRSSSRCSRRKCPKPTRRTLRNFRSAPITARAPSREVLYFDYKLLAKTSGLEIVGNDKPLDFRSRDWGSAPRWVAFVDFFVAAQARYAVVTGAHRRVGTTYAQLIAALAAANRHGREPSGTNFTFLSSVHSNLLVEGLSTQVCWGHIWNRYAGPLSCRHQPHQCALTPLLPPAWWDGQCQSPIPRDVRRLLEYGVGLSNTGEVDERRLVSYCRSRKYHVKRYHVLPPYKNPARS
ncbi:uncharacterized protein [Miscanthus floridulus]|uniref:uncharacterized protein n=1 Tax=Miscanthus floridulus TaxID=154761 RepID=UPI003459F822